MFLGSAHALLCAVDDADLGELNLTKKKKKKKKPADVDLVRLAPGRKLAGPCCLPQASSWHGQPIYALCTLRTC